MLSFCSILSCLRGSSGVENDEGSVPGSRSKRSSNSSGARGANTADADVGAVADVSCGASASVHHRMPSHVLLESIREGAGSGTDTSPCEEPASCMRKEQAPSPLAPAQHSIQHPPSPILDAGVAQLLRGAQPELWGRTGRSTAAIFDSSSGSSSPQVMPQQQPLVSSEQAVATDKHTCVHVSQCYMNAHMLSLLHTVSLPAPIPNHPTFTTWPSPPSPFQGSQYHIMDQHQPPSLSPGS